MLFHAESLNKTYGEKRILKDVDFAMDKGDIVSIIGPSGVGKTTLLKIIAGLESPDSGTLHFGTPPSVEHPVILVFQNYVLFPNLTVFENVAFGLRVRKVNKREICRRVMEMLEYFHMQDKANAYPNELSAGQSQRVAIARAMVVSPAMLLLDEPFANLDRNLKLETAEFVRETQKEFGVSTIAVTHDLEEAFVMSDTIGLILDGELVQYAPACDVYTAPVSVDAARFLGPINALPESLASRLGITSQNGAAHIRPEALRITKDPAGTGTVTSATFAGHYIRYKVQEEGAVLTVFGMDASITAGDTVALSLNAPPKPHRMKP